MRLLTFLYCILLLSETLLLKAQTFSETYGQDKTDFSPYWKEDTSSLSTVSIYQDERIDKLLETDLKINAKNPGFVGYRIQIFSGQSIEKEKAFAEKQRFEELYPGIKTYVVYQAPDFRIYVGNFRTKLESIHLYKTVKRHFSRCYPVKMKILFSEL